MNGIGRRLTSKAREQHADTVVIDPRPAALTERGAAARLAELERIHEDTLTDNAQIKQEHRAFIDALFARTPLEWQKGDPAKAALDYLHYLEDEADRCGIDRRPPWARPLLSTHDERLFHQVAGEMGAGELLGLPAPVRTAPETAGDTNPGPAPDEIPGSGPAGPVSPSPGAIPPPADAPPASGASGLVSTEDEPVAEQDCAEDGGAA